MRNGRRHRNHRYYGRADRRYSGRPAPAQDRCAARLMGAECIISGIRPQIASTIVHLGVDLGDVVTKATLADAFQIALRRNQMAVVKDFLGWQIARGVTLWIAYRF